MNRKKKYRVILPIIGACAILAGTAIANQTVELFIDGKPLSLTEEAKFEDGKVTAPVRDVAEAMGASVHWDKETRSVNIQTEVTQVEVSEWIRAQGEEKNDYYFEGLSIEEMNVDDDPEAEVLARIDGGVHLGNFFVFDQQSNGAYRLIFEQPWHVEAWAVEMFRADELHKLIRIVTRTGGTGMDVREAHLMYMSEDGAWTEAWKGTLKDRTVFQDHYHLEIGSYQFNDDTGQLYYWQTVLDAPAEDYEHTGDFTTTLKVFEFKQGRFVERNS